MFKNLCVEALGISGQPNEVIEVALSNGFKGIDLDLTAFAAQVEARGLGHARRLLDSSRLKLGTFALPIEWKVEDETQYRQEIEKLRPLAELAQQMKCARATATIEPASDRRPYHENFEFHRRRIAEVSDFLATYGIRLGIGFVAPAHARADKTFQFIQAADAALLLISSVAATNVGLVLDLWHWHLAGGTLDQMRNLPAERIVKVIVSDAEPGVTAESATDESRRLPGETGVIDVPAVLTHLAEIGYEGPITPKAHPAHFGGQSRDKIVRTAAAALDQVWKAAGLNPAGKLSAPAGK